MNEASFEQSRSGDRNYHYDTVISIAFINFTISGFDGQYPVGGSLIDRYSDKLMTERMRLIFIQLPQFIKTEPAECTSKLEKWIYTIKNLKNMESIPFTHSNPVFRRVEDLARKVNLTTDERREYERGLKHYQDYYSAMRYASEKSHAKGVAEGIVKGHAKGVAEEREAIISQMRAGGMSDEQISVILSLPRQSKS